MWSNNSSEPQLVRNFPSLSNFWISLVLSSDTKTFPEGSTASPDGYLKLPSPSPREPQDFIKLPLLSNFCTLLLPESATKTFPEGSTPIPSGPSLLSSWTLNWPFSSPSEPHFSIKLPLLSNFCIFG